MPTGMPKVQCLNLWIFLHVYKCIRFSEPQISILNHLDDNSVVKFIAKKSTAVSIASKTQVTYFSKPVDEFVKLQTILNNLMGTAKNHG